MKRKLTPLQRQILDLSVQGKSQKEIQLALGKAQGSVHGQIGNIQAKLPFEKPITRLVVADLIDALEEMGIKTE